MLLAFAGIVAIATGPWSTSAPAQLPSVTVRWEDPEQKDVVIVEGARYVCRVATLPVTGPTCGPGLPRPRASASRDDGD